MTRQIVQTAALGTAVLLAGAASVAFGAELYPNPHRIVRYLDAEADTTVNGVVNNGTIYKRGKGTATLPAPALNGGGSLVVSEGDVSLDLDAAPAVPTLPASLTAKIKLWLDPGVNIVVEDDSSPSGSTGARRTSRTRCRPTSIPTPPAPFTGSGRYRKTTGARRS